LAESPAISPRPRDGKLRRAVVLSGGGARGAYEAGVIRYIVEELPKRLGRSVEIDIVCGTSVGAIHACYLAATAHEDAFRGARLVDLWKSMQLDEMLPLSARDLFAIPRRILGLRRLADSIRQGEAPERLYGILNTRALERFVVRAVPWRHIRSNIREGRVEAVCVAATQIITGQVAIFIENRDRRIAQWTRDPNIVPRPTRLTPHHALASASIPMLFPAVRIGSTYYADGGLRLNTPLAPALRLGADRVLVIALRPEPRQANEATLAERRVEDYANPIFLFGKVLNALLLDPIDTDLSRMHLMNEILEDGEKAYGPEFIERINTVANRERSHPFKKIEDLVIRPTADLGKLAGQVLQNMREDQLTSPLLRLAARGLASGSGRSPESDLLSYLLFDGNFLAPLTELGYADARAQEEQLAAFFSDP
jgi:NTE family protein